MPFTDFDSYLAALRAPRETITTLRDGPSAGTASARWFSQWLEGPLSGVAPTTAVVPTNATAGSIGQQNATTGSRYVGKITSVYGNTSTRRVSFMLCDRLSHQAGLSGTAGGAQTTNLPTAALTRYTTGVGVMAGVEIYTGVGATPQTFTLSYTNQAGTGGQTTQPVVIGANGNSEAERVLMPCVAASDTGFRSVESLTLSGSTGTVGNFGITLFKPLLMFSIHPMEWSNNDAIVELGGQMPEILADACLFWLITSESTTVGNVGMTFSFVDV